MHIKYYVIVTTSLEPVSVAQEGVRRKTTSAVEDWAAPLVHHHAARAVSDLERTLGIYS